MESEITFNSGEELDELTFVESGAHNLKEINPIISIKGKGVQVV